MNFCLYTPQQEENIFIRDQAKTWERSGLINNDQLTAILNYTDPAVRQTNVFFRIIFFIFTCLFVGALLGLFMWMTGFTNPAPISLTLIVAAVILYFAAERAILHYKFYRYGIEEAFALAAPALLCVGCGIFLDEIILTSRQTGIVVSLLFAVCAGWIYLRFGFLYAAFFSVYAICTLPFQLSLSPLGERFLLLIILCLIFFLSIIVDHPENEDFRKAKDTTIQACLLIAIYLTVNLEILGAVGLLTGDTSNVHLHPKSFPSYVYWPSYGLTFIIPVAGFFWGIGSRKRLILNASLVMACATLATNKSYLGMTRYAWDPAILGTALVALSLMTTRYLHTGDKRARNGFTADDILKPESHGISLAEAAAALTPAAAGIDTQQSPAQQDKIFNGGSSGGGGASRGY